MKRELALSIVCLAATALAPAVGAADAELKDVKFGEHWYGAEWTAADLQGRVVLFEFWGIQ